MIYHSTRNEQLTASSTHAVLQGIAPDGGLYICDPAALHFDWRAALEKDTLPRLCARGVLGAEIKDGDFVDIGLPHSLAAAEQVAGLARPSQPWVR